MLTSDAARSACELADAGRLAEALMLLDAASPSEAAIIEATLGIHLHQAGMLDEALPLLERAAARDGAAAETFAFLGMTHFTRGRTLVAVEWLKRALRLRPEWPSVLYNLGSAHMELKDYAQAQAAYLAAIAQQPTLVEAWNGAALALAARGRHDEAVRHFDEALRLAPDSPDVLNNLAISMRALGKPQRAQQLYERCLQLGSPTPELLNNLGVAHESQGKIDAALACYERAIELRPDYAEGHAHRGIALLLMGRLEEGWPEYEWRWRSRDLAHARRAFEYPEWDGGSLAGKTILLHSEQGFGDAIQFARYAPVLAARGARVVIECAAAIGPLMRRISGVDRVVTRGTPIGPFDLHCPMLSVPGRVGTTLATIPSPTAYITADPARRDAWAARLPPREGRVRIGLVWRGNPQHRNDRNRSCALDRFAALAEVPGVQWISLQKHSADLPPDTPPPGLTLEPYGEQCDDFGETAALIANLDLVIGVDTSVIHLAGAMGVPTWTMLPVVPDWRWLLERADSPWYASMRLWRQRVIGLWEPTVEAIADTLQRELHGRVREGRPISPRPIRPSRERPILTAVLTRGDDATEAWPAQARDLDAHVRVLRAAFAGDDPGGLMSLRGALGSVDTPYLLWIDRDVFFSEPDWPTVMDRFARSRLPFDVAGHRAFHRRSASYQRFVERRPWWQGVHLLTPAEIKRVPFALHGCMIIRTDFARANDFPDLFLDPGRMDVALGDLVLQQRGRLEPFPWYVTRCFDWTRWPVEPVATSEDDTKPPTRAIARPPLIDQPAGYRPRRRLMIGVLSARARREVQQLARDGWMRGALGRGSVEVVILEGVDRAPAGARPRRIGDRLFVPTDDGPDSLHAKVSWLVRWALDSYDFDYLFKCDDDTFVHLPRLLTLLDGSDVGDYRGFNHGQTCNVHDYAHGGAGYLLSARACRLLSMQPTSTYYEDFAIGQDLRERGIVLRHDPRFNRQFNVRANPARGNDAITAHYVTTRQRLDHLLANLDPLLDH